MQSVLELDISLPPGWVGSDKTPVGKLVWKSGLDLKDRMYWEYSKMASFPIPLLEAQDLSLVLIVRTW